MAAARKLRRKQISALSGTLNNSASSVLSHGAFEILERFYCNVYIILCSAEY